MWLLYSHVWSTYWQPIDTNCHHDERRKQPVVFSSESQFMTWQVKQETKTSIQYLNRNELKVLVLLELPVDLDTFDLFISWESADGKVLLKIQWIVNWKTVSPKRNFNKKHFFRHVDYIWSLCKGRVQKFLLNRLVEFSIKWVGGVPLVH